MMESATLPVLVTVTDWLALTVSRTWLPKEREEGERLTASVPAPVPLKLIVWGLPLALSAMLTDALREPTAVGVNVTLRAQLAPDATLLPQLFVWEKSAESVPVRPRLVMLRVAVPVFESVTLCGALVVPTFCWPNVRLEGERLTTGAATPVPVKPTVCGLPLALSLIVSVALREPAAAGVNVTLMAQLAPAATELPQVFV